MKRFLIIFFIAAVFLMTYMFTFAAELQNTIQNQQPSTGKWQYPAAIKTYIPINHKRTIMMRHAFERWTKLTQNKIIFKYVTDPDTAQLVVKFINTIPNADREIGLTKTKVLSNGHIVYAEVFIADKTVNGHVLGNDAVFTVMLHEIGHAIGIFEHSKNPKSIMYPIEDDIQEILTSDLKTLAEIYDW